MRKQIWSLTAGHTVAWHWKKRFSTAESTQADALARVARGIQSGSAVTRSGLTLDQIRRSIATSAGLRFPSAPEPSPPEPPRYAPWPGAPNVFTRIRDQIRTKMELVDELLQILNAHPELPWYERAVLKLAISSLDQKEHYCLEDDYDWLSG